MARKQQQVEMQNSIQSGLNLKDGGGVLLPQNTESLLGELSLQGKTPQNNFYSDI